MKPKAVYFYTYLPPWRIDVFNEMGKYYDLTIIFLNSDSEGFTYNKSLLVEKLQVNYMFWNKGFKIGSRAFRFGIIGLIRKFQPVVVFSHEYSPTSIILAFLTKIIGFNYQLNITTSDNVSMAENVRGIKNVARKFVLNHSNGIIVYSQSIKKWYENHFENVKVLVCPNIQNPDSLFIYKTLTSQKIRHYLHENSLTDKKIILFIGRLVQAKGLDLLLNAFAKSSMDDYHLVIIGEGKEKNNLAEQTNRLNISQQVFFPGYYDTPELYQWYSIANFFILPSRYEPFGAVVNESLILGCPVLVSEYIGALEFIQPNLNGMIFDPLIEIDFVNALNECMLRYAQKKYPKENLMTCSFDDYVKNFDLIAK